MPWWRDFAGTWHRRPPAWSRAAWALILLLGALPWPWGEEIFARCYAARTCVSVTRFRRLRAWASAQRDDRPWRLALSLGAYHGRFIARATLIGIRDPDALRRCIAIRGEEHLVTSERGRILLGFHLGPRMASLPLHVAGHRVTWLGHPGPSAAWAREIRDRYREDQLPFDGEQGLVRGLYRARRVLLDGGSVLVSADSARGRPAFAVPVGGAAMVIRSGWLALRRATGAPVVPVLSHMEGHVHVVTVHPALPPLDPDADRDLERCHRSLGDLLTDYVRRFPEQCYTLATADATDE
jgi:lauroyl/myristoyl acyltransferase